MEDKFLFNINYYVHVKLTDAGYQRLADLWNESLLDNPIAAKSLGGMRSAEYYKKQVDKDGYTKFQMWEFMRKLGGNAMYMGMDLLFDADIVFQQKDLRPANENP